MLLQKINSYLSIYLSIYIYILYYISIYNKYKSVAWDKRQEKIDEWYFDNLKLVILDVKAREIKWKKY